LRARHVGEVAKQEIEMNRRQFAKLSALLAGLFNVPRAATAASQIADEPEATLPPTVTRVRIGTHPTIDLRRANREARKAGRPAPHPEPPDDENNYWADVFKDGDRYFYRAKGTTIEISEFEYGYVLANPNLYYFSQTVKVHVRLERARNGEEARIPVADFMLAINDS
jgi:hypothetical protein